jgi:hypothetical protein
VDSSEEGSDDAAERADARAAEQEDDRAAMRAFLQRGEVRLSTMHRVVTALLSGAGILVLLPAVERDSVVLVLRTLLVGPISWSRGLLATGVVLSIALALAVVWLLVLELTRFYFHSNHIRRSPGDSFAPRFTLTGLRLSSDELSPAADQRYEAGHRSPNNIELLVARNARNRARIDRQLSAYPGLLDTTADDLDLARAEAMFELAASRRRTLTEEVAKVEYGIVRHVNRLQVIVLRYVKALLLIVVTSLASFACAAAVSTTGASTAADERWIAGTLVVWAPAAVIVVAAPVRWLERLLRDEGALHTALDSDRELKGVERVTNRVAGLVWVLSSLAMVMLLIDHDVTQQGIVAAVVVLVGSAAVVARELMVRQRAAREAREYRRPTIGMVP